MPNKCEEKKKRLYPTTIEKVVNKGNVSVSL